eukprot:scaffold360_cov192-Amphora_coffeaeformis.AAC.10
MTVYLQYGAMGLMRSLRKSNQGTSQQITFGTWLAVVGWELRIPQPKAKLSWKNGLGDRHNAICYACALVSGLDELVDYLLVAFGWVYYIPSLEALFSLTSKKCEQPMSMLE